MIVAMSLYYSKQSAVNCKGRKGDGNFTPQSEEPSILSLLQAWSVYKGQRVCLLKDKEVLELSGSLLLGKLCLNR
jgi:hypothetical protein